jgi:hypothetical protein
VIISRDHTAAEIVLPHLSGVLLDRVESGPEGSYLFGRAHRETASCPGCGAVSTSVRGRYQPSLQDQPYRPSADRYVDHIR